ncbi:MAG: hypothetical protein ABIN80_05200 [Dyadobacter sp.]|uniref:hypothetical protein n=1 Tax=Dyadobacter sp. TaxID=1914288 RepID=UPI0032634499
MQQAFDQFSTNIVYVRNLNTLYRHLSNDLNLLVDLSDLLRAEIVYSVSALDKMIHEFIRIGMIQAFNGTRVKTSKFNGYTLSFDTLNNILLFYNTPAQPAQNNPAQPPQNTPAQPAQNIPIPPPWYWFEQEIITKHKALSFQDPAKISDGLSLIWPENHKWQQIAASMGINESVAQITLRNIIARRNLIVHEADIDAQTGNRNVISEQDAIDSVNFIQRVGNAIFALVV